MASLWTNELRSKAIDLYDTYSASVIAARINSEDGMSFSRNAVIGVLHRAKCGSTRTTEPRQKKPRDRRVDGAGPMTQRINRRRQGDHHAVLKIRSAVNGATNIIQSNARTTITSLRCVEVDPLLLTFEQLEKNSCRYVYGDGEPSEFRFCGHPQLVYLRGGLEVQSSYCGPHFGITYGEGTISERAATRGIAA